MNQAELAKAITTIAKDAGDVIMDIYNQNNTVVDYKGDDSPITQADTAAHNLIVSALQKLDQTIPVLSEESTDEEKATALASPTHWLVDPLDGTKEFVKRNGEFTVNIALIKDQIPILGVVYIPAQNITYIGGTDTPSTRRNADGTSTAISVAPSSKSPTIVVSRSHLSDKDHDFIDSHPNHTLVESGSSIKICLIADGQAHLYPRFNPLNQWDIAAADAVLRAAGGHIVDPNTQLPIVYDQTLLKSQILALSAQQ